MENRAARFGGGWWFTFVPFVSAHFENVPAYDVVSELCAQLLSWILINATS